MSPERMRKLAPLIVEICDTGAEIRRRLRHVKYDGPIMITAEPPLLEEAERLSKYRDKKKGEISN